MKRKYSIIIEETISENFEIEAEDIDEALKVAKQKYKNGEIVLNPGNLIFKQISASDEKGNSVDWHEF